MKDLLEKIETVPSHSLHLQIVKTNILVIETIRAYLKEARAPEYNPVKKTQVAAAVESIRQLEAMESKLQSAS
jgi:hypothetical protein